MAVLVIKLLYKKRTKFTDGIEKDAAQEAKSGLKKNEAFVYDKVIGEPQLLMLRTENIAKFLADDTGLINTILLQNIDRDKVKSKGSSNGMYSQEIINLLIKARELLLEKAM